MLETAENLREVINGVIPALLTLNNKEASQKPKPTAWSPKEVLGHLIDSANNNQMKFVRLIESNNIDVTGYHQNEWVAIQKYQEYEWKTLVEVWENFNLHIAHIIEHVPVAALQNGIKVEGVGPFTLEFIMKDYVEHLKHHLNQALPNLHLENKFKMVY